MITLLFLDYSNQQKMIVWRRSQWSIGGFGERIPMLCWRAGSRCIGGQGALLAYCEPAQFHLTTPSAGAVRRWQTKQVAHHFCPDCGCAIFSDSPAFEPDGQWDGITRRIGVNAWLFDGFDEALASVVVIDGKHLW